MPKCSCDNQELCQPFYEEMVHVVALASKSKRKTACILDHKHEACDMPELCGPSAWAIAHGWAQAVNDKICPLCGEFAIMAVRAIHDAVNAKLGKPLLDERNYEAVLNVMQAVKGNAGSGQEMEHQGVREIVASVAHG